MSARVGVRIVMLSLMVLICATQVSAAPTPGTVRFTAVGDFGARPDTATVLNRVNALDGDLTLALGDLSYGVTGEEQAWCDFVSQRVGAGYPFELLAGNHESDGLNGNINDFAACLPNQLPGVVGTYGRQYYVDVPAVNPLVRFVMISPSLVFPDGTHAFTPGSPRYQWTAQVIDGARSAAIPWVVVSMHKPCLTVGQRGCDPGSALFDLLLSKKVDLILTGHEHSYQRTKQLSLGAGCASVVPNAYTAACVADADDSFVRGAGSVAAVVGTGGNFLYDVDDADPEAGYFAVTSGRNKNPTYGVLDVSVTADLLRGSFVRASNGTLADAFSIARSDAPPNQAPVAAFTHACTDLRCTVDGSSSSDPDGTVDTYAWDFGGGSTGTGVRPAHTFTSAGTYPVALTVTDNGGRSASITRSVTVTGPTTSFVVDDQFNRTVTNGLGSAPTGGPWTLGASSTAFAVAGGQGSIRVAAGAGPTGYLASVSPPGADLRLAFSVDKQPTGSGLYLSVFGRRTTDGSYVAKLRLLSTGVVSVELVRRTATGSEVVLQSAAPVTGLAHTAGDTLNLRLQVVGGSPTTIRAKLWKTGSAEPSAWLRSVTDTTSGLQGTGSVAVSPYLSSGATNAPITVRMDSLTVAAP